VGSKQIYEQSVEKGGCSASNIFVELVVTICVKNALCTIFKDRNAGDVSSACLVELGDVMGHQFVHFFAVTEFDKCFTHATFQK